MDLEVCAARPRCACPLSVGVHLLDLVAVGGRSLDLVVDVGCRSDTGVSEAAASEAGDGRGRHVVGSEVDACTHAHGNYSFI